MKLRGLQSNLNSTFALLIRTLSISILLISSCAFPAHANESHSQLILFGGYDYESNQNTFQSEFLQIIVEFPKWEKKIFFAGARAKNASRGDSWSRYEIADAARMKKSDIRTASTKELLTALDEAVSIKEGLKSGDQLLLYFDAHGGGTPHEWSTDEGVVNSEILRPYLKTLRARNVKVGIIDDSCSSGQTVKQFSELACVLSSTQLDTYGCSELSSEFKKLSSQSTSTMESLYLSALNDSSTLQGGTCFGVPELSSMQYEFTGKSFGAQMELFKDSPDESYRRKYFNDQEKALVLATQRLRTPGIPDFKVIAYLNFLLKKEIEITAWIKNKVEAPIKIRYEIPRFSFFTGKSVWLEEILEDLFVCDRTPSVFKDQFPGYKTKSCKGGTRDRTKGESEEAWTNRASLALGNTIQLSGTRNPEKYAMTAYEFAESFYSDQRSGGTFNDNIERDQVILSLASALQSIEGEEGARLRNEMKDLSHLRESVHNQIKAIHRYLKSHIDDLRQYEGRVRSQQYLRKKHALLIKYKNQTLTSAESLQLQQIRACADFRL